MHEYDFAKDEAMVRTNLLAIAWPTRLPSVSEARRAPPQPSLQRQQAPRPYLEAPACRYGVGVTTIKPGFVDRPVENAARTFWVVPPDVMFPDAVTRGRRAGGWRCCARPVGHLRLSF
jgi:hypothetical protein